MSEILSKTIDPSKLNLIQSSSWRIGSEATPINSNNDIFNPYTPKVERATNLPFVSSTTIGGLCSIFTGDMQWPDPSILRMDQIVEAVGVMQEKDPFIIIEDSFFANLTLLNGEQFKKQGLRAVDAINRWFGTFSPNSNGVNYAFTSDPKISEGLIELVQYFSTEEIQNPNFIDIQAAPILLMYTGFWPKLLADLSIIDDENVVCLEPAIHFIDDRIFPNRRLTSAYQDFLKWLKENPYAQNDSKNQNIGIAGFWESRINKTFQRTRLLTSSQVPNTSNYQSWNKQLFQNIDQFPFPLRNSLIFTEGVNWGLLNPEIRPLLSQLVEVEEEYYQERKGTPRQQKSQTWAKSLKDKYTRITKPVINEASQLTQSVISQTLKEV